MKLVTFVHGGKEAAGILSEDEKTVFDTGFGSMNDLIEACAEGGSVEKGDAFAVADVEIIAPIPRPKQDVICLGINYTEHAKESATFHDDFSLEVKEKAIYFSKRVNLAPGSGMEIDSHKEIEDKVDYEVELAVIIGKPARNVKREDAWDYIFGYTVLNDMSARDHQTGHKQWYFGKSLDDFTPIGPCIVTEDEFERPPRRKITSKINGELRQDSTTDMLIHGIDEIIEDLTSGMTLLPGTIIATGTPSGVGMGMDPPCFLERGDVVTCEIEGIGILENKLK
ncbi:MAG: fumarylacetoacetate hydrolase family protein [Firmicutes bacterium]|nr:fumarylacetoacetate hydrolase family protein [Bacillota bacterium]